MLLSQIVTIEKLSSSARGFVKAQEVPNWSIVTFQATLAGKNQYRWENGGPFAKRRNESACIVIHRDIGHDGSGPLSSKLYVPKIELGEKTTIPRVLGFSIRLGVLPTLKTTYSLVHEAAPQLVFRSLVFLQLVSLSIHSFLNWNPVFLQYALLSLYFTFAPFGAGRCYPTVPWAHSFISSASWGLLRKYRNNSFWMVRSLHRNRLVWGSSRHWSSQRILVWFDWDHCGSGRYQPPRSSHQW